MDAVIAVDGVDDGEDTLMFMMMLYLTCVMLQGQVGCLSRRVRGERGRTAGGERER